MYRHSSRKCVGVTESPEDEEWSRSKKIETRKPVIELTGVYNHEVLSLQGSLTVLSIAMQMQYFSV